MSDLTGLKVTLLVGVAIILVLIAFFLVGPIVGMIVLLACVVLAIAAVIRVVRNAEVPDERTSEREG